MLPGLTSGLALSQWRELKLKATWSDCVRGKCGEEWDKCGGSVAIRPGAEPVEGVEAEGHMERLREVEVWGRVGQVWRSGLALLSQWNSVKGKCGEV